MNSLRIMTGQESDTDWRLLADLYQKFALGEGSSALVTPAALKSAVCRQEPGYRLAMIENHGFIAWTDHPDQPVEILDLFIECAARGQGLAQKALSHLIQVEVPARKLQVAVAVQNKTARSFYTTQGFDELSVQLLFPPPSFNQATRTYYDVEGDAWLPATWPTMPSTELELDHVVAQGARRVWINRAITTPSNWPRHPFACCYRLGT